MNLNSENKQAVHEVMIADMQKRLYEAPPNYGMTLEMLVDSILHTNSIADVNDVLIEYGEIVPSEYLTLDGTLNYVLQLLCNKITAHENDLRKYSV
tara:strand:- start:825 stop:1112 length:288 start_codon:yes stop_codon:yes gene_type:complete